ncbi:hypothetical protein OKW21_006049 [Catalinimonas alkaloidigena]|uniref:XkdF-like putative serine protease domain-containing protein n=1 Tax=Catalinimonas alkaloidigena TaxID=1075417 RepID=UPI00240760C2|nr:XkdF-like putative serine protease domain-containing protein [Catalinimonas alkaloidigena]MDF9800786.1 hypothetical protein [Catalinimonas alkaloidigena]
MEIPVYSIQLNDEDELSGVQTVSFVNDPAIESNFVALNKQQNQAFKFNKHKQIVTGAVLIPDKKIIRYSAEGFPYYLSFSSDQIEKLRDKFQREKRSDQTNIEHKEALSRSDMYVVESWIVSDSEKDKSQVIGLEKLPAGSWVMSYKVPDQEVFSKVLSGELNGFSIEAMLDINIPIPEQQPKPKKSNMKKEESKFSKFLSALKTLFVEYESESETELQEKEVKLATYVSGEMTIEVDDETGTVISEGVQDGEYPVEGGTLVVAEGVATFTPAESTEDVADIASEIADAEIIDETEDSDPEESTGESYILDNGDVIEIDGEGNVVTESVEDGSYTLEDGRTMVIAESRLVEVVTPEMEMSRQIEALQAELSTAKSEIEKLKNEKTELETKLSKLPAGKKIVTQSLKSDTEDYTKLSTAEKYAYHALKTISQN